MITRRRVAKAAAILAALVIAWLVVRQVWRVSEVTGVVIADGTPVARAVVRVKTTGYETQTGDDGRFVLAGFPPHFDVAITAWASGYYIAGSTARPWDRELEIRLTKHTTADNPEYEWVLPRIENRPSWESLVVRGGLTVGHWISVERVFRPLSARLTLGCADCHGTTIVAQWERSAHSLGTANIRLMTMYNGTDVNGNRSPATRRIAHPDYGRIPLAPDPARPYFGPGFKLDFPDIAGNCATCHVPTAAIDAPDGADLNDARGVDAQGIHCDFCHKSFDTTLDARTGLPPEFLTGVHALDVRRPAAGSQVFFGQFDDVDVGPDTLATAQHESRICAACHNASFWGTPIYESYSEWLASPYATQGVTCQQCHMPPDGKTTNFAPGRGGHDRAPERIFTHDFPGPGDRALLQSAVELDLAASRHGDRIAVRVRVTNVNAGHHIPTDHPMRNMLLIVSATASGRPMEHLGRQAIPPWGGTGKEPGDYAGLPGKGYAKVLEERWTEVSPTAAYWNQTVIVEDTRIPALATDETTYEFRAPQVGTPAQITARLVFRRAFKELADSKGWGDEDILMRAASVVVP